MQDEHNSCADERELCGLQLTGSIPSFLSFSFGVSHAYSNLQWAPHLRDDTVVGYTSLNQWTATDRLL